MSVGTDFSWAEVGERIRERRLRTGLSQQDLASAAGVTQNGIWQIEMGKTNPQITSLQRIAAALNCSVRHLVAGSSDHPEALDERVRRVKSVVESGDSVALKAMDNGLEAAEALLDRSGGRRSSLPQERKIIVKGQRSAVDELLWPKGPARRRSEVDDKAVEMVVRKGSRPFRHSGTTHETKNKQKQ